MTSLGFGVVFLFAAASGILWSLRPSQNLSARITPELVFRSPRRSLAIRQFKFGNALETIRPKRQAHFSLEVSDFASVLGLALHNGENPLGALDWVSQRLRGDMGHRLRQAVLAIKTGSSFNIEITALAKERKFAHYGETLDRLARAAQLGTDVSSQVQTLAESSISGHRVQLLSQQSRTELRMLLPLVFMILPTTILFAVYPSLQMLQIMRF